MKKSLLDTTRFDYNIVEKEGKPGVLLTVEGTFQRADTENANKRVYPKELWSKVLRDENVVERIQNKQMVGMFGHPKDGQTDPERISHAITRQELRSDGTIYGEAEIFDTPSGRILETLFRAGVKLGISSRGDGSLVKKGASNEVQDDYKLETYDFVLKPSTPGAYPGIVENVEENEKLVVEALAELVNSELPKDTRVPILTECLKILSVLESPDVVDQVKNVSHKITEEVGNHELKTLVSVVANEEAELPIPTRTMEESTMGTGNNGYTPQVPATLDPSSLHWHQQQVNAAMAQVAAQKEEVIKGLKDTLIKAQREHTETRKRLGAAEGLIEDFQKQIQVLEQGDNSPAFAQLKRRYEAAVELLDEAIKRLPEIGTLSRRCEALEGLCQAGINKIKGEALAEAIEEGLSHLPEALHEKVRPALGTCRTPEQVAETFKALMAVSSATGSYRRDPLPAPAGAGRLSESQQPQQNSAPRSFVGRVGARLIKAV